MLKDIYFDTTPGESAEKSYQTEAVKKLAQIQKLHITANQTPFFMHDLW